MSDFIEKTSEARLIGTLPGYVGYEEERGITVKGNNFFSIDFGKSLANPNNEDWTVTARIKSIEVVPTN